MNITFIDINGFSLPQVNKHDGLFNVSFNVISLWFHSYWKGYQFPLLHSICQIFCQNKTTACRVVDTITVYFTILIQNIKITTGSITFIAIIVTSTLSPYHIYIQKDNTVQCKDFLWVFWLQFVSDYILWRYLLSSEWLPSELESYNLLLLTVLAFLQLKHDVTFDIYQSDWACCMS